MRLCYTVATPECRDSSMLALRQPLGRAFALLRSAGYGGAELMLRDPAMLDPKAIAAEAAAHGLRLPAVSTGQLRKEENHQLCSFDEPARRAAVDALKRVLDFAQSAGAGVVNIGTLRGHLPTGEDRAKAIDAAERSLREALSHAGGSSVRIALEPQCRSVCNWLNTTGECLEFLSRFGAQRPGLVFDSYHALLEEQSMLAALIRARPHLEWVQVSDNDRRAPGSGHQHFGDFVRVLRALDFEGFISVECLQQPDEEASVRAAARHLIPYIEESTS